MFSVSGDGNINQTAVGYSLSVTIDFPSITGKIYWCFLVSGQNFNAHTCRVGDYQCSGSSMQEMNPIDNTQYFEQTCPYVHGFCYTVYAMIDRDGQGTMLTTIVENEFCFPRNSSFCVLCFL